MEEKIKKLEEELLPFGFLSTELDSEEQDRIDLGREGPKRVFDGGGFANGDSSAF
jgi:hypothetical protein